MRLLGVLPLQGTPFLDLDGDGDGDSDGDGDDRRVPSSLGRPRTN